MYWFVLLSFLLAAVDSSIGDCDPPILESVSAGSATFVLPKLPIGADSIELQVKGCPLDEWSMVFLTSEAHYTFSGQPANSVCYFRARGVSLGVFGPFSFTIPFRLASVPFFEVSALLNATLITSNGVLVSWRQPSNGGAAISGYSLAYDKYDGNWLQVFDGRGFPTVTEYFVSGLQSGTSIQFRLLAYNAAGVSSTGLYTGVSFPPSPALDPTRLDSPPYVLPLVFKSGETSTISIRARNPRTSNFQNSGGNCTIAQDPSCVPGRSFICFFSDVCEVEGTSCVSSVVGGLLATQEPQIAQDIGNGTFVLRCTAPALIPSASGGKVTQSEFSFIAQALNSGGLLGSYWENAGFWGDPVHLEISSSVNNNWGTGPVVGWTSEYVSARWVGYLKPTYSDTYTFYCAAFDYCRVWVGGVLRVDGSKGESFSGQVTLEQGKLYAIKVEWSKGAAADNPASISLQWSSAYWQVKAAIDSVNLFYGSFIQGAPFKAVIVPGSPFSLDSVVYGETRFQANVGSYSEFYLQARDRGGSDCTDVFGSVAIANFTRIASSRPNSLIQLPAYSTAAMGTIYQDGIFKFVYSFEFAGIYLAKVLLNNQEVKNSPFRIIVN